jgi:hypothetical protein
MYSADPVAQPVDEPAITRIGDTQVTATTVRTPAGTFPVVQDLYQQVNYMRSLATM